MFSSNGVNAAVGVALPLLFWAGSQTDPDPLLIALDGPLMVALTAGALLAIGRGHLRRWLGLLFALVYVIWIVAHLLV
jgi:Ca2+/Na+ antiporter